VSAITAAASLVDAGIVAPFRVDDTIDIIAAQMALEIEALQVLAAIESGEVWQNTQCEWHRVGRRSWHATPTLAWREPEWDKTKAART
jgi:hypothetical protein